MLISDNFVDHGRTLMMMMMMTTEDKDSDNYDGDSDDNKSILHCNDVDMILSLPLDFISLSVLCTLCLYTFILLIISLVTIQYSRYIFYFSSSFFKPRISIPEV